MPLLAQLPENPPVADSVALDSNKIEILFIRQLKSKELPTGRMQELIGDVHLKQQAMHLWCDYGIINPNKQVEAFGNVQMLQEDSIRIFSDTLLYDGNTRQARLRQNVVLQDTSMTLFTEKLDYDLNTKIATFPEGSLIESDTMTLVSQKGTYNANTNIAHFSDSVRVTGTQYKLIADSLDFNTQTEVAYFIAPTTIYHGEKTVYCEDGYYDGKKNYAELKQNARFENVEEGKEELATGDKIIYDGEEQMYYLIGNAYYENETQAVNADTILLDAETDQYYFRGNPKFRSKQENDNQSIDAQYSDYDAATKTMIFRGEVELHKDANIILADSLDYNTVTKSGLARGNVNWRDTSANTQITAQVAQYNDSTEYIKAYGNPVLQTVMDNDTMWLRADTLISMPVAIDSLTQDSTTTLDSLSSANTIDSTQAVTTIDSTQQSGSDTLVISNNKARHIKGYYNVLIYKSDMQVVCDSLFYDDVDSIFHFYGEPILWADGTQFTADTMAVKLKRNKLEKVLLYNNSFIITKNDSLYYNQTKGKDVIAYFAKNNISLVEIMEEGETVYYIQDENDSYVGVNDVNCEDMILFFAANQLQRIRFEGEPNAVLYPMGQVNHESLKLEGFQWLGNRQPQSKQDLYNYDPTKIMQSNPIEKETAADKKKKAEEDEFEDEFWEED